MAGKPPEVKILGDASGAKKASKDAAAALDDYADALAHAGGVADDTSGKLDKADDKVTKLGKTSDSTKKRLGDFGDDVKAKLGPIGDLVGGSIDDVTEALGNVPIPAAAAGVAIGGAVAALAKLGQVSISKLLDEVAQVQETAALLQTTGEEASKTQAAFEKLGVPVDDLGEVLEEFGGNLADDREELEKLGLTIITTKDGQADLNATLTNAIDLLHNTTDPLKRAELGSKLFGEQWFRVQKAIEAGGEELEKVKSELKDFEFLDGGELQRAQQLQTAMANLNRVVENLAIEVGTELAPYLTVAAEGLASTAQKAADAAPKVAEYGGRLEDVATFIPFIGGPLGALGATIESVGEKTEEAADAAREEMAAQQERARQAEESRKVAEEQAAAEDALRQTLDNLRDAEDRAKQAHEDRVNAALALLDGTHSVEQAERAVERALIDQEGASRDLDAAINEHGVESEEARVAALNLADSEDAVEEAYLRQAQAAADARIKNMEAAGQHLDASGKAAIQRDELAKLAATLEPGSPLRAYLDGLIGQLDAIPRHIPVEIQLKQSGLNPALIASANQQVAAALAGRASGGPVSPNQAYVVGEEGPEIFAPKTAGTIIPNGSFASPGSPVSVGAAPVHIHFDGPLMTDQIPEKVKKALARAVADYQRSVA